MPEHRRGTEKSAEDLVGPPEWMESERRSTAAVWQVVAVLLTTDGARAVNGSVVVVRFGIWATSLERVSDPPYHCCRPAFRLHPLRWTDKILCRFFGAPTVLRHRAGFPLIT